MKPRAGVARPKPEPDSEAACGRPVIVTVKAHCRALVLYSLPSVLEDLSRTSHFSVIHDWMTQSLISLCSRGTLAPNTLKFSQVGYPIPTSSLNRNLAMRGAGSAMRLNNEIETRTVGRIMIDAKLKHRTTCIDSIIYE
jgi:hypothetical protein